MDENTIPLNDMDIIFFHVFPEFLSDILSLHIRKKATTKNWEIFSVSKQT